MTTPEELADLLARCALNDRKAFENLYQQSSPQLFGIVLRIVRDREYANDVLQEAFVKIWGNAGSFDTSKAKPMTWMGSIARNQAIDHLRRLSKRPQGSEAIEDLFWLADEGPGPDEQTHQSQEDSRLHECLEELQGQQKQAMLLAYFKGMTHEELAQHLDAPLGTVKSWVRRGLARLKQCLEEKHELS